MTVEDLGEYFACCMEDNPVLILALDGKTYRIDSCEYLDGEVLLQMGEEHEP
jgi:hypothetical protein